MCIRDRGYAFLKASATDGAQNNTIKNCAVTLNKTNTVTVGIYCNNHLTTATTQLVVTDTKGTNSYLKIYSNTINNCYVGIAVYGYNSALPYDYYDQNNEIGKDGGNNISNFGGSTVAKNGIYTIYQNNLIVANNTVTGTVDGNGNCAGIQLGSSANGNLEMYGNTVTIQYNGTGSFYGIYDNMGTTNTTSNTINIHDNSVTGCSIPAATSGSCYFMDIAHAAPNYSFHGNIVSNNTYGSLTATATGSMYGVYLAGNGTTDGNADVYNNQVVNNSRIQSSVGSGSNYLFYQNARGIVSNTYNNSILNNTTSSTGSVYCFYLINGSVTKNFYGNTINGINNANGYIYGVYNGNGTEVNIYKNTFTNFNSNAAGSVIDAIYISSLVGAGIANINNNFISELRTPNASTASTTNSIVGIYLYGSTGAVMGVYNNTVYLDAESTGANFYTTGVYMMSNSASNDLRNNIVINKSVPTGTGVASAISFDASTSVGYYSTSSNNNNFYAGIPSANHAICFDGSYPYPALVDFKTLVAPKDNFSIAENTSFINTATSPYDLHVNPAIPAQVESAGAVVSIPVAITTDIDGDARFPNPGYPVNPGYPAMAPDMGADEFGGIPNDITPPSIVYTPFDFTAYPGVRNLVATITDANGVPLSGAGLPRLAWKKSINGTWSYVTGTSLGSDQYNFAFGTGTILGDTVYYFIVAQDEFSTPAVGCYPFAGASGFSANPPACSVPPTFPSSYVISAPLCGTYIVGAGQTFTTLTDAVYAYNHQEMTCPVVFQLKDAIYSSESLPLIFNTNPGCSETNTLTIKPAPGISPLITGSSTDCAFKFNGSRYIIFDGSNSGGSDRSLTIKNDNATAFAAVFKFTNDGIPGASDITIKNCSTATSIAGIYATYCVNFDNNIGKGGYTNITMDNNEFTTARFGVIIGGTASNPASNIRFTNNIVGTNNDATGIVRHGVEVQYADNILIEGNEVMGQPSGAVPLPIQAGIYVVTGSTNVKILGNKVHDWISTSTGVSINAYGIVYSMGSPTTGELSNNVVYNIKHPAQSTNPIQAGNPAGIAIGNNIGNLKVYNNSVFMSGNYLQPGVATSTSCMNIGSGNTQLDIRNNILKNSSQPSSGSPASLSYAIVVNGAPTLGMLNNNDYFVDGVGPAIGWYNYTTQTTLANWQTATGLDSEAVNIDPGFTSPTNLLPTSADLNNKGVYIASLPMDILGALRNDPADVGAYEFGDDPFIHTLAASAITTGSATLNGSANAAGTTLTTFFDCGTTNAYGTSVAATPASVTGSTTTAISYSLPGLTFATTYHYRARSISSSGMISFGEDMTFTTSPIAPTVVTTAATSITAAGASLNGTVNPNGGVSSVTIQYGLTTSYGNTLTASPASVNGMVAVNVSAPVTGLLPYTTYHFRVVATNVSGTTNGNDMTFITNAVPSSVTTIAATNIVSTDATLNGSVNANNAPTNVTFEWGLTTAYGNTAIATPASLSGNTATSVSADLSGLALATIYHFRCVGNGPGGIVYGADKSFTSDCPSPVLPGAINGSQSVCKNSTAVVYSVAPISGATGYDWTLPTGVSITSGSNTNSITVDYSPVSVSGNIEVAGTNSCGTGLSSTLAVVVNELPIPTISGPVAMCLNSTGNVYITESGMSSYVWNITGGTITAGAGTNSITVTWETAGLQTVTLNYANSYGCFASTPSLYAVNVNALPVPTISGETVACESSAYLDYTTEAGMTNYVWDITPGSGTITQTGTNVVTIFWTAPGAKWVSVNYVNANGCYAATPTVYNVTVNPLPGTPGTISGSSSVCAGASGVAYSVAAVTNANTYVWSLPAGATIASGTGTNSVTVDFSQSATSGDISVLAQNACGDGMSSPVLAVTVNAAVAAAGTITGTTTLCQGTSGITYSVSPITGATAYNWTVPAGSTIASGSNTNSISVDFGSSASSGNVTVAGSNSCGTGTSSSLAVTVNPKPATPVITQNLNVLTSDATAGNQWYRDGIVISGATNQTYEISENGTYTVVVTLTGCSSDPSNEILILSVGISEPDAAVVSVYPNPGTGEFWLSINAKGSTVYEMELLNNVGAVVYKNSKIDVNGSFKQHFNFCDLPAGMYTISLRSASNVIVKRIVISK
jgi:hypothetical protein